MLLGWKNQYCENDCTAKCNLQIHCDPCQITKAMFYRLRTKNFKLDRETKIAKPALRENEARGINLSDFRLYCKATVIETVWFGTKMEI